MRLSIFKASVSFQGDVISNDTLVSFLDFVGYYGVGIRDTSDCMETVSQYIILLYPIAAHMY